jgi:hypothetical protein
MFAFFSQIEPDQDDFYTETIDDKTSSLEILVQSLEEKQIAMKNQYEQCQLLVQSLEEKQISLTKQHEQSQLLVQSLEEKQIELTKHVAEQQVTIQALYNQLFTTEQLLMDEIKNVREEKHTIQNNTEDRWTNPQNTFCNKVIDGNNKDCTCLDCMLHDKFTSPSTYSNVRGFCPFGTNCTCVNANHRSRYKHLIQYNIITGRDTELSPLQVFYCTENFQIKKYTTKRIVVITPNIRTGNPFEQIVNCTKKDGIDYYQYVGIGNIVYDATEHELYYTDLDPTTNSHSIEKAIQK